MFLAESTASNEHEVTVQQAFNETLIVQECIIVVYFNPFMSTETAVIATAAYPLPTNLVNTEQFINYVPVFFSFWDCYLKGLLFLATENAILSFFFINWTVYHIHPSIKRKKKKNSVSL